MAKQRIFAKLTRYFKASNQHMLINISQAREKGEKWEKKAYEMPENSP